MVVRDERTSHSRLLWLCLYSRGQSVRFRPVLTGRGFAATWDIEALGLPVETTQEGIRRLNRPYPGFSTHPLRESAWFRVPMLLLLLTMVIVPLTVIVDRLGA